MGLFSFVKDAGARVFNKDDDNTKKQKAIEEHIAKYNMFEGKVRCEVEGATVKLYGEVSKAKTKAHLMVAAGNIDGVENVENYIVVKPNTEMNAEEIPKEGLINKVVELESEEKEIEDAIRYYDVKKGDTLSAIAKEMYGNAMDYPKIFEANKPMLTDPDKIYPGQKLIIPQ